MRRHSRNPLPGAPRVRRNCNETRGVRDSSPVETARTQAGPCCPERIPGYARRRRELKWANTFTMMGVVTSMMTRRNT